MAGHLAELHSTVSLASVGDLKLPMFQAFMAQMNEFAEPRGLRTFTNWSKVWEYPWLWFNALGRVEWPGKTLVDLGSELSPAPWFVARYGAKITLVETHPNLIGKWDELRKELNVEADYKVVSSEILPLPDGSVDVVSSFSVIEHQPDKRLAIDEVARVLKPGGLFAISFDVCQAEMGMTFPEWNGKALSMDEFEQVVWTHPSFGNHQRPKWNTTDVPDFLKWHRQSAEHHNYVVGAAVLIKRGAGSFANS